MLKIVHVDKLEWIQGRITEIYAAVSITNAPPTPESSGACNYCKYKKRSQNENLLLYLKEK
jgi:hypothetical protein